MATEVEYRLENCPKCGVFGKTAYVSILSIGDMTPGETLDLTKMTIVCHEPVE